MEYFNEHFTEIIWALLFAVVSALLVELFLHPFKKFKEKKKNSKAQFSFSGKSANLTPQIVMGLTRPYNQYYFKREFDSLFASRLNEKKNLLISGPPLAGKSRAVYQLLTGNNKTYIVAIPRFNDIHPESFSIPKGTEIIFIDDLQRFVEKNNFDFLFKKALEKKIIIIATCHSDLEYEKVKNKFHESNLPLETVFSAGDIFHIPFINDDTGKEIAEKVNLKLDKKGFNKTIGSIFMNLTEMEKRFNDCQLEEKTILRVLKDMYTCGVYEGNLEFSPDSIKIGSEYVGLTGKDYQWAAWFESLKKRQFILIKTNSIIVEECYLERIVKPHTELPQLEIFRNMTNAYSQRPAELLSIASKAYDFGRLTLQWAEYMKISLNALDNVLKKYTFESSPLNYAIAQNSLARTYNSLAEIEDRSGNCRKSINACEEALKVYTMDSYPMQFAMTQINLSGAYIRLAEFENRIVNCKNSIRASEEALRVSTPEQFTLQYAGAQFNLGIAYRILAELENRAGNCSKSVSACDYALKIYDRIQYPVMFATMHNILGLAYVTLAEAVDKALNCNKAINAFEQALEVCSVDEYPNTYATTQNNLGTAYFTLAEAENKPENCRKSINAYEEVLKLKTFEKFPIQYAMAHCNLGHTYSKLAEVEDKAINCRISIKSCNESLRVYTPDEFPILFATVQNILALAYEMLAGIEDKTLNCIKSIKASEEALKVYTPDELPVQYASTLQSLGDAYSILAEAENKDESCKKGISAYKESLNFLTEKDFPKEYHSVINKLNKLEEFYNID